MEDCIFCKIIKGEIPSTKVYEDENVLAFKDINPAAPIHILVVPKQHIENVLEINEENKEIASNIFLAINKIAKQLGIDQNGFRVITNCGKDAGQMKMREVAERFRHMLKVKECRHLCLTCEYYEICKREVNADEYEIDRKSTRLNSSHQ